MFGLLVDRLFGLLAGYLFVYLVTQEKKHGFYAVSSNSENLKYDGSLELNKCLNIVPQSPSVISIYTGKEKVKIPGI